MTQNAIVLSASQYKITDDKGNLENSGCTLRYILSEDMSPAEDRTRGVKGHIPAKANIPFEDFDKLGELPGLYELTMTTKIDSKGVVSLVPSGFKSLGGISITKAAVKGFPAAAK